MDNAQVFPVPIDSALENSMEDAVVRVDNPTFSYNTQSPVSGLLTNSVRYEGDGIFADWYRHRYGVRYTFPIDLSQMLAWERYEDFFNHNAGRQLFTNSTEYDEAIVRNFWFLEDMRYAVEVSFPWTPFFRDLDFVNGFGVQGIINVSLPWGGSLIAGGQAVILQGGSQVHAPRVIRPEDSFEIQSVVPGTYNTVQTRRERYFVSGQTHKEKNRLPFHLMLNPYDRTMDEYEEGSDLGAVSNVPSQRLLDHVPENFEASVVFGRDDITVSVIHKTFERDNTVVMLPMVVDHNTANDLTTQTYEYTILDENNVRIDPFTHISFIDRTSIKIMSTGHTQESTLNDLVIEDTVVHDHNTVNEVTELTAVNPTGGSTDLNIFAGRAIVAVAEDSYTLTASKAFLDALVEVTDDAVMDWIGQPVSAGFATYGRPGWDLDQMSPNGSKRVCAEFRWDLFGQSAISQRFIDFGLECLDVEKGIWELYTDRSRLPEGGVGDSANITMYRETLRLAQNLVAAIEQTHILSSVYVQEIASLNNNVNRAIGTGSWFESQWNTWKNRVASSIQAVRTRGSTLRGHVGGLTGGALGGAQNAFFNYVDSKWSAYTLEEQGLFSALNNNALDLINDVTASLFSWTTSDGVLPQRSVRFDDMAGGAITNYLSGAEANPWGLLQNPSGSATGSRLGMTSRVGLWDIGRSDRSGQGAAWHSYAVPGIVSEHARREVLNNRRQSLINALSRTGWNGNWGNLNRAEAQLEGIRLRISNAQRNMSRITTLIRPKSLSSVRPNWPTHDPAIRPVRFEIDASKREGDVIFEVGSLGAETTPGQACAVRFRFDPVFVDFVDRVAFGDSHHSATSVLLGESQRVLINVAVPEWNFISSFNRNTWQHEQFLMFEIQGETENERHSVSVLVSSSNIRDSANTQLSVNSVDNSVTGFTRFGDLFDFDIGIITILRQVVSGGQGTWRLGTDNGNGVGLMRDYTNRRIFMRRCRQFSRNGMVADYELVSLRTESSDSPDRLLLTFVNEDQDAFTVEYNTGIFGNFNQHSDEFELSTVNDYVLAASVDSEDAPPVYLGVDAADLWGRYSSESTQMAVLVSSINVINVQIDELTQDLTDINAEISRIQVELQRDDLTSFEIVDLETRLANSIDNRILTETHIADKETELSSHENLQTTVTREMVEIRNEFDTIVEKYVHSISRNGLVYRLLFRDSNKGVINFLPVGLVSRKDERVLWQHNDIRVAGMTTHFTYLDRVTGDRENAVIDVDFHGEAIMESDSHDLRDGSVKRLALANSKDDYAILTAQFNSDAYVENHWYIDEDHILKLTSDHLILLRREEDGDRTPRDGGYWGEIKKSPRSFLLGEYSDGFRYGVSCAVQETPYLYVIEPTVVGIRIHYIDTINMLVPLGTADTSGTDRGVAFSHAARFMRRVNVPFSDLSWTGFSGRMLAFIDRPAPSFFVNQVRLSATRYNDVFLLGIVYDKGVHQWTLTIRGTGNYAVFNGYGCVGIDGTVTGGAVPIYAMNQGIGLRVPIRRKPTTENAFNFSGVAFISGQSLCFLDENFTGGICTYAHFTGSRFRLNSLPLRFSRKALSTLNDRGSNSSTDINIRGAFIFPNPMAIFMATTWVWARAAAGAVLNYWSVNNLAEEEDFFKVEVEKEETATPERDILFKMAMATSAIGATIGNAMAERVANAVDRTQLWSRNSGMSWREAWRSSATPLGPQMIRDPQTRNMRQETPEEYEARVARDRKQFYPDTVGDALASGLESLFNGSTVNPVAIAPAYARLGMGGVYSISANQNVFAGPGFTQIQFVQGSRISGSHSNSHSAYGGGSALVPRLPPIPIPFIGPIDINNTGLVGVNSVSGPVVAKMDMEYQPNVNIGQKNVVYSYPITDMQVHSIGQTLVTPVIQEEREELYKSEWRTRHYQKKVLKFERHTERELHADNCSMVQGVDTFYDDDDIMDIPVRTDSGLPVFSEPGMFDYCVYPASELYYTAIGGEVTQVSVRDTVVLDGEPSNVVIKNMLPLIASTYACVEITNEVSRRTLFPRVFSGDTVLFNTTGHNIIKGLEVLHGFDGYTNRIASLVGEVGVDSAVQNSVFSYVEQGAVKTGSLVPPTSYFGKFSEVPKLDTYLHRVNILAHYLGNMGRATENLQGYRFALPIVHQHLGRLPAAVQVISPYKAFVINGITSLTTDTRNTNPRAKSPKAFDFFIYGQAYRVNHEYISRINAAMGVLDVQDVVATLGLIYVGSTPRVAWFYAPTTHAFFTFTGSDTLDREAVAFRFRGVTGGSWDFVTQEVAFRTILDRGFDVDKRIFGDLVRVTDRFEGNIYPPNENLVNHAGEYLYYGLSSGLCIQGPTRGAINRFVIQENMIQDLKYNNRADYWDKIRGDSLDDFYTERKYHGTNDRQGGVIGWTLNPYKLATGFLGPNDSSECQIEWEINFAMTDIMREIIGDKYVTVHACGEMLANGGMVVSEVTNIYLRPENFVRRKGGNGYYSFRFNARNGIGSAERLYLWSDGLFSVRSIDIHVSEQTGARTFPLVTRVDIQDIQEF